MRVTNQMMFENSMYNYQKTMSNLQKANQEVSSGMKIQHGYENSSIFVDTMRLDYDITTLQQTVNSSSKAKTFADNSDKTLNQMSDILSQMKVKLIKAANSGTNSTTSMEAIANDLQSLKESLIEIANTSINGKFLFSGTATDEKPISSDGTYNGNDKTMSAVTGSKVELPYNISGYNLFLGKDSDYNKSIETNIPLYDQTIKDKKEFIQEDSTMKQLVGNYNGDTVFYMQGRKPNGETFSQKFTLTSDAKMSDLLKTIGKEYGNKEGNKLVDVSLNKTGQIVVKDNKKGNNILDFHLVAATDKTAAYKSSGAANVNTPNTLTTTANIKITEFIKSGYKDEDGNELNPFTYDKAQFTKSGKTITGDVSQVVANTSEYAKNTTKLSEVAGESLSGESFTLQVKNTAGNDVTATINLDATNSTFTVNGNTYTIYDGNGNQTAANDVTYRQLNDIVSMVTSSQLPALPNSANNYNTAITSSRSLVETDLDYRGRMQVVDKQNSVSNIEVSLYNTKSENYSSSSKLTFSSNNALTIDEPSVDVFKDIDNIIEAVKNEISYANGDSKSPRNSGIQAALKKIEHLSDHISKQHSVIGSISNSLSASNERAELLTINVKSIQSEIVDSDIGESYLKLTQYSLNYQAILQASSRINQLSLVNYM